MSKEENYFFKHKFNALKHQMFLAIHSAEKAHNEVFSKPKNDRHEIAGVGFLTQASSYMSSAYSIYYSNLELFEDSDAEEIFHAYFQFSDELLKSFSENHSYQHTDIYFDELIKAFKSSPFNSPITDE